jgi:AbrB family looped-hinge helix DNA binding protein
MRRRPSAYVRLSKSGQIDIPDSYKRRLGLGSGDRLKIRVETGRRIVLRATPGVRPEAAQRLLRELRAALRANGR